LEDGKHGSARLFLKTGASISLIRSGAAALGAIGSIWVARRLGPEKLGISALVASIVAQVALILEMQQQSILVREYKASDSEVERENLLQVVQSFRLVAGGVVVVLFGVGCYLIHHPENFNLALWAFPPLLLARMGTPTWIFQAREKNIVASLIAAGQQLATLAAYLVLVQAVSRAGTDLWCQAAAAVIFAAVTWGLIRSYSPLKVRSWRWAMAKKMRELAWRGRWLFLAGASAYAYGVLEGPLMGYLLSVKDLGKYRSAQSLAGLADLVGIAIPTILFPRFIEWRKQGVEHLWSRQLKIAGTLLVLVIPAAFVSLLVVPRIHRLIYGAAFADASIPAAILIVSKLIIMLNGVFAWGLIADGSQDRRTALLMVSVAVISVSLNLTLLPRFGITSAAIVNVVSESAILVGAFLMCRARIMKFRGAGLS
jgi:O-antigen/teichoic acid export membrane protein